MWKDWQIILLGAILTGNQCNAWTFQTCKTLLQILITPSPFLLHGIKVAACKTSGRRLLREKTANYMKTTKGTEQIGKQNPYESECGNELWFVKYNLTKLNLFWKRVVNLQDWVINWLQRTPLFHSTWLKWHPSHLWKPEKQKLTKAKCKDGQTHLRWFLQRT